MARDLVVRIVGDASSLDRAFKKGARSARGFDRSMRGSTLSVKGFHRSLTGLTAGLLGGVGLTVALRSIASEMSEMQKVTGQTNAVLASTGGIAGVTAEHVDELAKKLMNLSGVDDELIKNSENLLLTFTNIRNVVGEGNDIFDQAALATLNLSTRFGRDLTGSAITLGKALQDPERGLLALSRSGVQFTKAQKATIKALVASGRLLEAQKIILAEVQKQTKGAAAAAGDTLAGKLNLLRETALNLGGALATTLLPVITPIVDKMIAWLQSTENQQELMRNFKGVVEALGSVLGILRDAFSGLNEITGSTRETVKLLLAAFLGFKALQIISSLGLIATQMGLVSTRAEAATGKVRLLRAQLALLAAPIAVTIVIELVLHKKQIDKKLQDAGLGFLTKSLPQNIRDLGKLGERLRRRVTGRTDRGLGLELPNVAEIVGGAAAATRRAATAARQRAAAAAGAAPPGEVDPAIQRETVKRLREAREAFRQEMQERAAFAVERAAATATLADDLAALNRYNALLARRIKGGHATLELEREQFSVQQQIADVLKQQAEARAAQRQARQFRLLGFGPGGEELVPGVKTLQRQLQNVDKVLAGSFLDTKKTRSLIAHIRTVLSGSLGRVGDEVRSKIQQILADLRSQLKQSSVDVTRWQTAGRGQFTLAGAHAGPVVVNGGVHLHGVQNVRQLENELARRTKQRAHSRRVR